MGHLKYKAQAAMKPLLLLLFPTLLYAETTIKGFATRIYDGDTITIVSTESCPKYYKVRLQGIDAPELKQSYGKAARRYAMRFAFGRLLTVTLISKGKYGRWIGRVCRGQSSPYACIGYQLVRKGLAWHYSAFSDSARLARAEKKARAEKVGLWKNPDSQPPWEFRKIK